MHMHILNVHLLLMLIFTRFSIFAALITQNIIAYQSPASYLLYSDTVILAWRVNRLDLFHCIYSVWHFKSIVTVFKMFLNRNYIFSLLERCIKVCHWNWLLKNILNAMFSFQFPTVLSFLWILPCINIKQSCAWHLPRPFFYFKIVIWYRGIPYCFVIFRFWESLSFKREV